ncbi:glycine/betaine ABC transporter substrate-binding protein [Enemella dayhoffiae]|uniref:Glycine/betaine ABC transporter substrate-binding protein n=1 Tax=Enemella dayhoffiae TaxID=2016507 RepID=A0A255H600_9ACTN|nr:glycine betaine ABC transporter substrate-binding protein [Enemella dayhoffiae]OYO23138.1 glycine/betaine ABC transporter substrate-binding protein [Enemella dayhoffiae]
MYSRAIRLFTPLLLLTVLLAGCGLGTAGGFAPTGKLAGALAGAPRLDGVSIKVGSKNFSEQLLLGKMAVILFQSAGANVQDLTNIPGSQSARQAMLQKQTNFQWEYTGTAWVSYLKQEKAIPDEQGQWQAVKDADAKNGLVWLKPAPMNNTYSFAMTDKTKQKLNIRTMSELQKVPVDQLTFCLESEFANRNDGFQPWLKTYGLPDLPPQNIKTLDTGAIYEATAQGLCNFGEVFTTDGRIKALNLTVLEDDKKYFPNYNVAPVITTELNEKAPQLEQLLAPVQAKLDNQTLLDLNARIDVDGEDAVDVAWDWLQSQGFLSAS